MRTVLEHQRLLDDTERGAAQIDVPPAKRLQLAEPKPGEARQQHQQPMLSANGVGEDVDLGDSRNRPLVGTLTPGAHDLARVRGDAPVLDRRVEDRPQEPVRLGCR